MAEAPDRAASRAISEPRLRVEALATEGDAPRWTVRWRIANAGDAAVRIVAALQPHSGFRGAERSLDLVVEGGDVTELALPVAFAGALVENAFVILSVAAGDERWRVLVRARVVPGERGEPRPLTTRITTQPVGSAAR